MDLFLEKIISASPAALIDFYADWCEPCKWVVPILDEVEKYFNGKIRVSKIDIDKHAELSKSLLIHSVPTLVLFVDQKEVWRMRGFDAAPALIKNIEKFIQ